MENYICLLENNRQNIANYLTVLLANEYILYTKTRNAYWNVKTTNVHNQPILFEIQFSQLNDIIDRVAKHIHELDDTSVSVKIISDTTHLCETVCGTANYTALKKELLIHHESIINLMQAANETFSKEYNDENTTIFIARLIKEHEKMAWFLRSVK